MKKRDQWGVAVPPMSGRDAAEQIPLSTMEFWGGDAFVLLGIYEWLWLELCEATKRTESWGIRRIECCWGWSPIKFGWSSFFPPNLKFSPKDMFYFRERGEGRGKRNINEKHRPLPLVHALTQDGTRNLLVPRTARGWSYFSLEIKGKRGRS